MSGPRRPHSVRTRIWQEEPEPTNPFAARIARCHGYDVYGQMLGRARWTEMLWLLLRGERPSTEQADLLEALAVALANAGPRDPAVHAAMCGGVGGSTSAACLMAALAAGAGQYGGAREVFLCLELWNRCATDLEAWSQALNATSAEAASGIWPEMEHPPGFDPHGTTTATIFKQTLHKLAGMGGTARLTWLAEHRTRLEAAAGCPIGFTSVAAAALADLGFDAEAGEMLFLLLRLPGAAAHALEQRRFGHKEFPFFALELADPVQEEIA